MSGTPSRRPCVCPTDADVDPDTVPGVYRGGQEREPRGDAHPKADLGAVFGETETLLPRGKGVEGHFMARRGPLLKIRMGNLPKRGKIPSSGGLGRASDVSVELYDEDKPLAKP